MGDTGLRCRDCHRKLGELEAEERCTLCLSLFRLRELVLSDRFPLIGVSQVEPLVRTAYWRALELVEAYRRACQGGEEPPRGSAEKPEGPAREEPSRQGLSAKAKSEPPPTRRSPPTEKKHKKKRKREGESRDRDKSPEKERKRSASPEKKKKRRSKSPKRSPEKEIESAEEEQRTEDIPIEPVRRDRREERDGRPTSRGSGWERSERPKSPNRSPLRPRSPPGPPPRGETRSSRWSGPIPAYYNRPEERPPLQRKPQPENKGVKKRKQQRAWRKNKAKVLARRRR